MYITGIDEIFNVWANDVQKIAVFNSLIYLPFNLIFFITLVKLRQKHLKGVTQDGKKHSFITDWNVEIFIILNYLAYFIGSAGVGQVILIPLYDVIVRCIGLVIFNTGSLLNLILNIKIPPRTGGVSSSPVETQSFFYSLVRFPQYSFLILIGLGQALLTVNPAGILIIFFLVIPFIVLRVNHEEQDIISHDKNYIDYKSDVPMVFPRYIQLIRMYFIKRRD